MPNSTAPTISARCPICETLGEKAFCEEYTDPIGQRTYQILVCADCSAQFAWPFEQPGAEWYKIFSPPDSYEGCDHGRFHRFLEGRKGHGQSLLDIGCGTGDFLHQAKQSGYEVVGVDINEPALKEARRKGLANVFCGSLDEFRKANPDATFDVVTAFEVLEHLSNPNEFMRQIAGLLRPGGTLAVSVPNADRPMPFARDVFDQPPHHLSRWTADALRRFLRNHGYMVEEMETSTLPTWEFSRHTVYWTTQLGLRLFKRLSFGKAAGGEQTLTALMGTGPATVRKPWSPRGWALWFIREKSFRTKLVSWFGKTVHCAVFPLFVWFALYYKLVCPGRGISIYTVSKRQAVPTKA